MFLYKYNFLYYYYYYLFHLDNSVLTVKGTTINDIGDDHDHHHHHHDEKNEQQKKIKNLALILTKQ